MYNEIQDCHGRSSKKVSERRGRRRKQPLDDLKEERILETEKGITR